VEKAKAALIQRANQLFTPGSPVQQKDLFSGRSQQLIRLIETLPAPGRHPVVFGRRGVGKTSLANVLAQVLPDMVCVKVSCDGSDTFATIWNRIIYTASVPFKQRAFGFSGVDDFQKKTLADVLGHDPSTTKPAEIADLLTRVEKHCVVILDEFDKISDTQTKSAFADLIKIVSDNAPKVTIVLVGVAENIHELTGDHPSVDRNLVQIEMPLMSDQEIREIYSAGMQKIGFSVDAVVLKQVEILSGGFPHYAHLLGLCSARVCIANEAKHLPEADFGVACSMAVEDAIEKFRDAYVRATATTQVSRYPTILTACAYAKTDERGVFRATDVADAISQVFKETVSIQALVPALGEFCKDRRGAVLRAVKVGGRKCYRFRDPMMRPYCRLKLRELLYR
jgi:energy-coupling factor transporter ATP-binding protein EcfA2